VEDCKVHRPQVSRQALGGHPDTMTVNHATQLLVVKWIRTILGAYVCLTLCYLLVLRIVQISDPSGGVVFLGAGAAVLILLGGQVFTVFLSERRKDLSHPDGSRLPYPNHHTRLGISDVEDSTTDHVIGWLWWRPPVRILMGLPLPVFLFYIGLSFPYSAPRYMTWFMLFLGGITLLTWPGLIALPFFIYRRLVTISARGFTICRVPFEWRDVRHFWIENHSRDRKGVAFTCTPSCRKRLTQLPFLKRMMLLIYLPFGSIDTDSGAFAFPTDLNISAPDLLSILSDRWKTSGDVPT
jgi:hypothetical protein